MYKRLFSFLLCVSLIICMAAVSFADDRRFLEDEYPNIIYDSSSSLTVVGVFQTSVASSSIKDFLVDFWTTQHENYNYVVAVSGSSASPTVNIVRYPVSTSPSVTVNSGNVILSGSLTWVKATYDSALGMLKFGSQSYGSGSSLNIGKVFFSSDQSVYTSITDVSRYYYRGLNLAFEDNGGLAPTPEPEEPEEPEEPSSSAPPTPTLPEIPAGDGKYVPYDTGAWLGFLIHILSTMSTAARIGIIIFASLLGILLIIWVIRWFLPRN